MKVVILTTEQGNQVALCNKLAAVCEVTGIVLSRNVPRKSRPFVQRLSGFASRASVRMLGRPFLDAWNQMQQAYAERYPKPPDVPVVRVNNINDDATLEMLQQQQPDLIVVSGTNLVNRKTMESAPQGARFVNLHTGISPFVKGGPNCSNWCLAEGTFHLIGNTIMWLDLGIDSGNIITTEQTELDGNETLFEMHWKVMEHAHDLYCRVVSLLAKGPRASVSAAGKYWSGKNFLWRRMEWPGRTPRAAEFQTRLRRVFSESRAVRAEQTDLKLIPLEAGFVDER